jgi:hypothetical protein
MDTWQTSYLSSSARGSPTPKLNDGEITIRRDGGQHGSRSSNLIRMVEVAAMVSYLSTKRSKLCAPRTLSVPVVWWVPQCLCRVPITLPKDTYECERSIHDQWVASTVLYVSTGNMGLAQVIPLEKRTVRPSPFRWQRKNPPQRRLKKYSSLAAHPEDGDRHCLPQTPWPVIRSARLPWEESNRVARTGWWYKKH